MANKHQNTQHLKIGNTHPDPIHRAKLAQGEGVPYANTAVRVEIHQTPDSQPGVNDGELQSKNGPNGRQGWTPMNEVAARHTYTGPGGSKRD